VPVTSRQEIRVEVLADGLPRWRPGQACEQEPLEIRLLLGGEAVWETALPIAVRDAPWDDAAQAFIVDPSTLATARRIPYVPSEDELRQLDQQGTPIIQSIPAAWANELCGRLAHHPCIVAWSEPEGGSAKPLVGRCWV